MSRKRTGIAQESTAELVAKTVVLMITISIGLWCGYHDSFVSFYIAVFIQALNNCYDSYYFLNSNERWIRLLHLVSLFGSILCSMLSLLHLSGTAPFTESIYIVSLCSCLISIPLGYFFTRCCAKIWAN